MGGSRSSSNVTEEGSSQHRATGTLTLTGGFQVKNDRTESGGREGGGDQVGGGREDCFAVWLQHQDNAAITLISLRAAAVETRVEENESCERETSLSVVTFVAHDNNTHL